MRSALPLLLLGAFILAATQRAQAEGPSNATATATTAAQRGDIVIRITGVKPGQGQVTALLFQSDSGFPGKEAQAAQRVSAPASAVEITLRFSGVPFGVYAITVYQDLNANQKLDTNWIGIPKEPVAVSNNAKGRMGPPKYKDARFSVAAPTTEQRISLIKL